MFNFPRYNGYKDRNSVYLWVLKDYVDFMVNNFGGTIVSRKKMVEDAGYIVDSPALVAKVNAGVDFKVDEEASGALEGITCYKSTSTLADSDMYVYAVTGEDCKFVYYGLSRDVHAIDEFLPKYFSITYDANEGTGTTTDPKNPYAEGTDAVVLESAFTAPENKEFDKWNESADGSGQAYVPGDVIKMTADVKLFAIWKDAE